LGQSSPTRCLEPLDFVDLLSDNQIPVIDYSQETGGRVLQPLTSSRRTLNVIVVSGCHSTHCRAKISRLCLLRELFSEILIPEAVFRKVVTQQRAVLGLQRSAATWNPRANPADRTKVDYLRADLDPAKQNTGPAQEVSAAWVLLDEPKARVAAELLACSSSATLGLSAGPNAWQDRTVRPLLDESGRAIPRQPQCVPGRP